MSRRLLAASFRREDEVLSAVRRMRKAGYSLVDVYAPYPVHGLDEALGLEASKLPILCFLLGSSGALFAFLFQAWVSTVDWPLRIGGKPFYAWPSFIPIAFEVTVLCAGLGTVAALLLYRRLFPWKRPAILLPGATDDRFVVAVDRETAGFDGAELAKLCRECGAVEINARVEQDG